MLKKIIAVILTFCISLLCGCSYISHTSVVDADKINILCTTFPQYDWVCNITKGSASVQVSFLLADGTDIHSFQPSADDIIKISSCDMFIYNGGISDSVFEDILSTTKNAEPIVFNMMKSLKPYLLTESQIEIAEQEHAQHNEYDEHIWLSLKNASLLCKSISDELIKLNPSEANLYEQNTNSYIEKLNLLDSKYLDTVNNAKIHELVFVDRFPFRYLANDYSITCYAAFPGCSSETDASFNTILYLAEKINELGNNTAITIDNSNIFISDTVKEARGMDFKIYEMNSLQSVTAQEVNSGLTYLSAMEDNLSTLTMALN